MRKLNKDSNRIAKKSNPVAETSAAKPDATFDLEDFKTNNTFGEPSPRVGRPRKNKVYSTIRLQKHNVNRVNALQNTLDFDTQDALIASLIDRIENTLENEQRIMFDMYMKTYTSRDNKKNK